jgi:hypothetical protein
MAHSALRLPLSPDQAQFLSSPQKPKKREIPNNDAAKINLKTWRKGYLQLATI